MLEAIRKRLMKNDEGVSPVVGTILMIAATVAIGATVFTAVNAFGGSESTEELVASVFSVKAVDLQLANYNEGADGKMDGIKITYTSGPELAASDIKVKISHATAKDANGDPLELAASGTLRNAGDWATYDISATDTKGEWYVTILVKDTLVVDRTIKLDQ